MKAGLYASFLVGLGATLAVGVSALVEPQTAPLTVSRLGDALQRLLSIDDASAASVAVAQRCDDTCRQNYGVPAVDVLNRLPQQ